MNPSRFWKVSKNQDVVLKGKVKCEYLVNHVESLFELLEFR